MLVREEPAPSTLALPIEPGLLAIFTFPVEVGVPALTVPPFITVKLPVPPFPTVTSPALLTVDPAPLTVTVPEDPGWFPTTSVPQLSTPPLVTARLPPPASPTVVVSATERLAPEGLPPFTPSIWFEPALEPTINAGSVSTAVPTMSI